MLSWSLGLMCNDCILCPVHLTIFVPVVLKYQAVKLCVAREIEELLLSAQTWAEKTQRPWWHMLKVSHACQLGQAAVGHFHKVPMEQVIGRCWHEQDRSNGADGPVLHWPCIPAPHWGPRRGLSRLPERRVSHWHPGNEPCPVLACTHLCSPPPSFTQPPSASHPAKHPKRWPSPQGSGQPPGLTMGQTTSCSLGRSFQVSMPRFDFCRRAYQHCKYAATFWTPLQLTLRKSYCTLQAMQGDASNSPKCICFRCERVICLCRCNFSSFYLLLWRSSHFPLCGKHTQLELWIFFARWHFLAMCK